MYFSGPDNVFIRGIRILVSPLKDDPKGIRFRGLQKDCMGW